MGTKGRGLERTIEEIGHLEMMLKSLQDNPDESTHLYIPLLQNRLDDSKRIVECVEQDRPFIASSYTNAPEICTAMDIHWYSTFTGAFGVGGLERPHFMEDLEGTDQLPVPADLCTLLRLGLYAVEAGIVPIPTAMIAVLAPCDGATCMHEAIRNHEDWRDIPIFGPDPPYFDDGRSVDYFAAELRRMASFIEEHTGHKLHMDRLREVVEESNDQYGLWHEYSELRRAVPCPHGASLAMGAFVVAQGTLCGRPSGTAWLRDLVADAEKRVLENRPQKPNEKIRVLWYDVHPVWFGDLNPWLEEEWGASVVQNFLTLFPYTTIDTSSDDAIWKGLAKRNLLDTPMVRQAGGTVDVFAGDLTRIVKDFKIDCVIWPGHMGHKDGAAAVPVLRETCRGLGVPFLHIGLDQFDRRYTSIDEVKNRIARFFTAMRLG